MGKHAVINDISILSNECEKLEKRREKLKITRKEHVTNIGLIEKWKKYQVELKTRKGWKDRIANLEEKEKDSHCKYSSAVDLKEKILEAESIAMMSVLESINTHARIYLDSFFTEDPVFVQLQSFRQTKKSTKPKVNISIEYKGMECTASMLSGGELARVILAYTLALAEMFNTPLLLLDECTANLDQNMTGKVFSAIRRNFHGKLVIIIAHQIVEGTFDTVVNLNTLND